MFQKQSHHGGRPNAVDELHVLLLRHGQTDSNAGGIIQGHLPVPLNALGRRQAALLAGRVARWSPRIERLICSDLARAVATAEPIARACGLNNGRFVLDPAWRERGLGEMEGRTVGEHETWRAAGGEVTPPGAEPIDAFRRRVLDALAALPQRYPAGSIAVMTHGGSIRAILRGLAEGEVPATIGQDIDPLHEIGNCSLLHLVYRAAAWRVECVNDTAHLAELASCLDSG